MSNITKEQLAEQLADETGLTKTKAGEVITALTDIITKNLKKKQKVSLIGFGSFEVRKRAAREGRNPRTGQTIKIAAANTPAFKAGKALKDAVN